MQEAFQRGFEEDFGQTEEVILPEEDIDKSLSTKTKIHLMNYIESRSDNNSALFVSLNKPHNRLTESGVKLRLREIIYHNFTCNDSVLTRKKRSAMIRKSEEVCFMDPNLNVANAPKDTTFQVRINSEIKRAVEDIYAKTGMTLTDAFNTFIQQSLNVEGLPFIVTKNSKEVLKEQAIAMLMLDLKRAEERANAEGWIDADDLERELGVID